MKKINVEIYSNILQHFRMLNIFIISILLSFSININAVYAAGSGDGIVTEVKDTVTAAGGTLDTILDTLSGLTCETQGIGNLLRSEFTHTCIPAPFLTFVIANIVSPGVYANTFLRLAINDEELFPGACLSENRVEYDDQKISFAMCRNDRLLIARTAAIAGVGVTIAKTLFTGENVWDAILGTWNLPKDQYFEMFLDKKENDEGLMVDIGIIPFFPWKVIREKDKLCVATLGFLGWLPVGCKYIKEPYPISIYADFMNVGTSVQNELDKVTSLTSCSNMGSCYQRAYENSRAAIVVSGPIIECVKEMVAKMMISTAVCSFDDVQAVLGSEARRTSAFFLFQKNMHRIVSALLTLYIILFGFKIVLGGDIPQKSEIINFVLKFLFVVYFSVGININVDSEDDTDRLDGMIEWTIPFLMNGMESISSWIISSDSNNFCNFQDVEYPPNLTHLKLWDALDCRVMNYLGLDTLMRVASTLNKDGDAQNTKKDNKDNMKYNIPPFIMLMIPAILSGVPILALMCLTYPIFIISFLALMVSATVVCIVSIVILAVLAPLFVPLFLFNYTKGYFEAWVKLLISFMLQPMVIVAFMTLMMALNDKAFNGTCKFDHSDVVLGDSSNTTNINIMSINLSDGFINDGRTFRFFFPNYNWQDYDSDEEIQGCKDSLSYFVKNIVSFDFNTAFGLKNDDSKNSKVEDAVIKKRGMFFTTFELVFEKIRMFAISLIAMYLITYLMTKFGDTITEFAADMTEGVSVGTVTVKPATIQAALKKAGELAGEAVNKVTKGGAKGFAGRSASKIGGKLGGEISEKGARLMGKARESAIKGIKNVGSKLSSSSNDSESSKDK